uniref:Zinc finger and SCAN domain containing 10 n=1 Tax=Oryctolagus cuniculus TaxID=9986 RepID=G1TLA2_RABIT
MTQAGADGPAAGSHPGSSAPQAWGPGSRTGHREVRRGEGCSQSQFQPPRSRSSWAPSSWRRKRRSGRRIPGGQRPGPGPRWPTSCSDASSTRRTWGRGRPWAGCGSCAATGCGQLCTPRSRSWSCWCWSSFLSVLPPHLLHRLQGQQLRDGEEVVLLLEGIPGEASHSGPLDFSFSAGKNCPHADIPSGEQGDLSQAPGHSPKKEVPSEEPAALAPPSEPALAPPGPTKPSDLGEWSRATSSRQPSSPAPQWTLQVSPDSCEEPELGEARDPMCAEPQGPALWSEQNSRDQELAAVLESLTFEDVQEKKTGPAHPLGFGGTTTDKDEFKKEEPSGAAWPPATEADSKAPEPPAQSPGPGPEASCTGAGGSPSSSGEVLEATAPGAAASSDEQLQFLCTECGVSFRQLSRLKAHQLRSHPQARSYVCLCCGKSFGRSSILKLHMRTHTDERPHACHLCTHRFRQSSHLTKHLLTHSSEPAFLCAECGQGFQRRSSLVQHLLAHTQDQKPACAPEAKTEVPELTVILCTHCGQSFQHRSSLKRHLRIHARGKDHRCSEPSSSPSPKTKSRPYVCGDCGKAFRRSEHLVTHRRLHTGERPFSCEACGRSFTQSSQLVSHQRVHTGEKPHTCAQCGKSFVRRAGLARHLLTHGGLRPHHCAQCGKSFMQTQDLARHLRSHTGEKPCRCSQCGEGFSQSAHLARHQRIHTGEKPHACDTCGHRFRNSSNLARHRRSHTGERPYSCPTCGRSFRRNAHLQRHLANARGVGPRG